MSGLGTSVPNGIVPLLSSWFFLFTKGTIVPINAFPFRVAVPLCWREELKFLITYVPFLVLFLCIIVPALKIGSFLFIGGTIVPINGSGLNEMEQFVPNHKFLFM